MFLLAKPNLEWLAIPLTSFACGAFLNNAVTRWDPLQLMLACVSAAFLCREIHFAGTSIGVYVVLVFLGVWAILWRDRLVVPLERGQVKSWLAIAATMYLLSQLIARRVFAERHLGLLPNEDSLHVELEEFCETVAHLCLIVTSFAGRFGPIGR